MELETQPHAPGMVVRPRERRLDAAIARPFREELLRHVADGHTLLVIDMAEVQFVDSSGLGALLAACKAVAAGGEVLLCDTNERIRNLLRLTRTDHIMKVFPSREEALHYVDSRR